MVNKILVPLDGSELAAIILPHVIDLAKTHGSQVTLLHVYHADVGEATPGVIKEAVAQEKKRGELFLAQGVKEVKAECVEGSPAREIIGFADKNAMDLIPMATHGKGGAAWVLGSVAEKVLTHAPVSLLLFRVLEFKPPEFKEFYPIP